MAALILLLGRLSCASALAVGLLAPVDEGHQLIRRDAPSIASGICQDDVASLLTGYAPALSWCSTSYPVASVTLTATDVAKASTVTSTDSTQTLTSTVSTETVTVTGSTDTAYSTTVVSLTRTTTRVKTLELASTSTTTATTTTTTTIQAQFKRSGPGKRSNNCEPLSPQESAFRRLKAEDPVEASAICACIETPATATVTSTATPVSSLGVTATTVQDVTASVDVTVTATTSVTTFSTNVLVVSQSSTVTTVVAVTSTTSTTVTLTSTNLPALPIATCAPGSKTNQLGAGGCSSNCYCDVSANGVFQCDTTTACRNKCASDADCSVNEFCAVGGAVDYCGGSSCVSYVDCTSTYQPPVRRGLRGPDGWEDVVRAAGHDDTHRNRRSNGSPPITPWRGLHATPKDQ